MHPSLITGQMTMLHHERMRSMGAIRKLCTHAAAHTYTHARAQTRLQLAELEGLEGFTEADLPTPEELEVIESYINTAEEYIASVSGGGLA